MKFEHIFAFAIVGILGASLFGAFWINDKDLINMVLVAFIGGLSAITAFFFTKYTGEDKKNDSK